MPAGIVENFDLLHQIATEFNLGPNYDWFSDSSARVEQFFNGRYSPVHNPDSPQNSRKSAAEKTQMKAKYDNVKRLMTAVMGTYNLNDNGEMRKVFSDLYTGKTNDALVPVEEDDSEPVAQAGSSNAQTATAAAAGKDTKKSKKGKLVGRKGGYDLYVRKDKKGNLQMVRVKVKKN